MKKEGYNLSLTVPVSAGKLSVWDFECILAGIEEFPDNFLYREKKKEVFVPGLGGVERRIYDICKKGLFKPLILRGWSYKWGNVIDSFHRHEMNAGNGNTITLYSPRTKYTHVRPTKKDLEKIADMDLRRAVYYFYESLKRFPRTRIDGYPEKKEEYEKMLLDFEAFFKDPENYQYQEKLQKT